VVAELSLERWPRKEGTKDLGPEDRGRTVDILQEFGLSERRSCRLVETPRSTVRYKSVKLHDQAIRASMRELADRHRHFGHPRLYVLLPREGFWSNRKKTHRIYVEVGL